MIEINEAIRGVNDDNEYNNGSGDCYGYCYGIVMVLWMVMLFWPVL